MMNLLSVSRSRLTITAAVVAFGEMGEQEASQQDFQKARKSLGQITLARPRFAKLWRGVSKTEK